MVTDRRRQVHAGREVHLRTEASGRSHRLHAAAAHGSQRHLYGVSDFPTTEYGKDKVTKHLDGVWDSRLIKVVGGEAEIDGLNELKRLLSSIQTSHQRFRTQEYEVTVGGDGQKREDKTRFFDHAQRWERKFDPFAYNIPTIKVEYEFGAGLQLLCALKACAPCNPRGWCGTPPGIELDISKPNPFREGSALCGKLPCAEQCDLYENQKPYLMNAANELAAEIKAAGLEGTVVVSQPVKNETLSRAYG